MRKICYVLLVLSLLFVPTLAYAQHDEYGYNDAGTIFNGTFDNWEAFIHGQPPLPPVDPYATDVLFLIRNWDANFDQAMFHGAPWQNGAWSTAHFYTHLSGEQLGWTWNCFFKLVYSSTPLEGAVPAPGMPDFYLIQDKTWLTDPQGQETVLRETHAIPPSLGPGSYQQ